MKTDISEIETNGVEYVRKDSISAPSPVSKDMVIVRAESAGVFIGSIKAGPTEGGSITLTNARRLWYWSGAASLSQLAVDGTNKPKECKFPVAVPEITILKVIEVIPCTEIAKKSLMGVAVWSA